MSETIHTVVTPDQIYISTVLPGEKGDQGEDGSAADLGPLQATVAAEIDDREAGDAALDERLDLLEAISFATDSELATAVAAEASLRSAGDSTNATAITAEAGTRGSADTTLQGNLDDEAGTRAAADTALDGRVDVLEAASTDHDTRLDAAEATLATAVSDLAQEVSARDAGDTDLAADIASEAGMRAAADAVLDGRLDTEEAATAASDVRLDALEATAPSAGQKAALAGTSGAPGPGNEYVTDADARNTDTRTPTDNTVSTDKLQDASVTLAKAAPIATDSVLGRSSASTGPIEVLPFTDQAQQLCDDTSFDAMLATISAVKLAGQLGGSVTSPDVRGLRETAGPTLLTLGAIADGEYVKRSGSTLIGGTPAGGGSSSDDSDCLALFMGG